MIHIRRLTKSYSDYQNGDFIAVDSISFDALPGQIFGLLGPNGAGKTTALRILATLLKPTSGSVTINGYDVTSEASNVRHQIGFVSTNTATYDRMTGWELVEYFGRLYGMQDCNLNERMEFLFERFQMERCRNLLCSKMSTGMKQKVSIARALVHDPPVVIFDEATSGLDILAAREVLDTVQTLRDQGKCIVFSSHIMSEIKRICDRVAIMNRGRILTCGTTSELVEQHKQNDLEELFFQVIADDQENQSTIIVDQLENPSIEVRQ